MWTEGEGNGLRVRREQTTWQRRLEKYKGGLSAFAGRVVLPLTPLANPRSSQSAVADVPLTRVGPRVWPWARRRRPVTRHDGWKCTRGKSRADERERSAARRGKKEDDAFPKPSKCFSSPGPFVVVYGRTKRGNKFSFLRVAIFPAPPFLSIGSPTPSLSSPSSPSSPRRRNA